MAAHAKDAYRHIGEMEQPLPGAIRVGHTMSYVDEMSCEIPVLFPWTGYRGLNIVDHDDENSVYACRIMSAILLRIYLQAQPGKLLIHQVDPRRNGADMQALPVQPDAPRLEADGLKRLLDELRAEMNRIQVNGWRCDTLNGQYTADTRPVHIIAIANWDDLKYRHGNGETELSDAQKAVLQMLETNVAARHGIYFFICSDDEVKRGALPLLTAHDEEHVTLHAATPDKPGAAGIKNKMDLCFRMPSADELETLHKALLNYMSGSLDDEAAEGTWLGNSAKGLRAVMGTTPQGENQYFELGQGRANNAFHALVGGATGSGKSVLLNEIICSLAERYSPEELRMILLDYKEGTEFAPYRNLPHVFALSIGSNPEFGLECLKWVGEETERRSQLFKACGVNNITDYRKATGEKLCRYLIVADEFQVLCTDKRYGDEARRLLNDLVRRTRSFGMNFLLSTQTLRDGALESEAKNQFACRICLALAESETDLFLSTGNSVPAHFNRKGQALVNYMLGQENGNIPFQGGNRDAANGMFSTMAEIAEKVARLKAKAEEEGKMPQERYIYDGEGFAPIPADSLNHDDGFLIGMRLNMTSTPFLLSKRHVDGGVLIVGNDTKKGSILLQLISAQSAGAYGAPCPVQTTTSYLDAGIDSPLTILAAAAEGDMDLEEAVAAWKEDIESKATSGAAADEARIQEASGGEGVSEATEGIEPEFADLMKSMQANFAAVGKMWNSPEPQGTRHRRRRDMPLVVSVCNADDVRVLEAAGVGKNDFRVVVYTDVLSYNRLSGDFTNAVLTESQILVEYPKGVATKVRLCKPA